ncbi:MAG: YqgE/AlgH family protein [Nannocystaceae bacterium]
MSASFEYDDDATTLACHVLCAVPQLADPNFVRSVVLLIEHNDDGAFGLVVNNTLPTAVADVAESLGLEWEGSSSAVIHLGGPVEPVRGFVLHDQPSWDPLAEEVMEGIWLTMTLDAVRERKTFGARGHFRFILGYAGWSAGQLEAEMASGSWIAVPLHGAGEGGEGLESSWVLRADPEAMWSEALSSIGVDPARFVGHHGIGSPIAKA